MSAGWLLAMLVACASGVQTTQPAAVPQQLPLVVSAQALAQWQPVVFPGKLRTAYRRTHHDGRACVHAESLGSASMLRQHLQIPAEQLGLLDFAWQVDELIEKANLLDPQATDSPASMVLAFDGDRSTFSPRDAMLSELSHALTGEPMPYATLMYVWSNDLPVDTVVHHGRTGRIRKIVVDSGPVRLRQWIQHSRDVRADFVRAFGEQPGPLVGMAVMTDSDNTRSQARAWYGDIRLMPAATQP